MSRNFKLAYAPHFGLFEHLAGKDLLEQLKFAADQGFSAWEDNDMKGRAPGLQEKIASEMGRLGMRMGVFIATASFQEVTFAGTDAAAREQVLADLRASVDVARRVRARCCTVVPGLFDLKLDWGYQMANGLELLKRCCEICEPSGLVMVLEPLNRRIDHPRVFLAEAAQAYLLCRAVNHPSCKMLFDVYHQQITEGNLIPNLDAAWSEIAYVQVGDTPGRKEPGTGEINYRHLFRHLHGKGYSGIVGMEHGLSRKGAEGERALIDAYAASDDF